MTYNPMIDRFDKKASAQNRMGIALGIGGLGDTFSKVPTSGLAGIFAGTAPLSAGQTAKSLMTAETPGSAVMKSNLVDDDMAFLDKMLDKKFGYEKRGASIRQGMGNAEQANAFLYGLGNKMMGLG